MKGVFLHKLSSVYDDEPAERYHFPGQYLKSAKQCVGDWILYYEPGVGARQYKAVARIEAIIADPVVRDKRHYYARVSPGTYLDFPHPVPLRRKSGDYWNTRLQKGPSNLPRKSVRLISDADFAAIVEAGLGPDIEDGTELPRTADVALESRELFEAAPPFGHARERAEVTLTRTVRDRAFRAKVLQAYDRRCAFTRMKFINGGGRAEVQAAHIRPVKEDGPDSLRNGVALSGTVHWMFDRGLLSMGDAGEILVSRHINNLDEIDRLIPERMAALPAREHERPHPAYLAWHRERVFKL